MNVRQKLSLAALCFTLPAMASAQAAPAPAAEPAAAPAAAPAPAPAAPALTFTPYGFVHLGSYWNSATLKAADYPGEAVKNTGGSFLMSARGSRFGVRAAVKDTGFTGADLLGRLEFDFYAGQMPSAIVCDPLAAVGDKPVCSTQTTSAAWNNALLRLRYATIQGTWAIPTGKLEILAGQTDGLVNALAGESVAWAAVQLFTGAGNYVRRTPQLRLTYMGTFAGVGVNVAAAMLSPADATKAATADTGVGNVSRRPDLEARAGLSYKVMDIGGTVGVSYHTNTRRYVAQSTDGDVTATALGVDADLSITKYASLKAEYYKAKGTDDTYGGIAATAATATATTDTVVASDGYWAQLVLKPIDLVWLTAGYGKATADKGDLTAASAATVKNFRTESVQMFGGVIANLSKNWKASLEVGKVTTTLADGPAAGDASGEFEATQIALGTRFNF